MACAASRPGLRRMVALGCANSGNAAMAGSRYLSTFIPVNITQIRRPQFLFPDGARLGPDNVILHARARRHSTSAFAGPLSIKTVVEGTATWTVDGRGLVVDPGSFLVLGA